MGIANTGDKKKDAPMIDTPIDLGRDNDASPIASKQIDNTIDSRKDPSDSRDEPANPNSKILTTDSDVESSNTHEDTDPNKESVWLRLFDKVKNLEKNVSLSGEYLEKLSIRYKTQIEELQKSLKNSDEALKLDQLEQEKEKEVIKSLQHEIGNLHALVVTLEERMDSLDLWRKQVHALFVSGQVLLFFIVCILFYVGYLILRYLRKGTQSLKAIVPSPGTCEKGTQYHLTTVSPSST